MTEYWIDLQDKDGTSYGHCYPNTNYQCFYEDLDEARMDAKSLLRDEIVLARVVDYNTGRIVDFFEVK